MSNSPSQTPKKVDLDPAGKKTAVPARPAAKAAVKAPPRAASKPAAAVIAAAAPAKARAKPAAKAAAAATSKVPAPVKAGKPAAAVPVKAAPAKAAAKVVGDKAVKEVKEVKHPGKKPKLVRDSFTFPAVDYALFASLKQRALKSGHDVKKSELLRAGLAALAELSDAALLKAVQAIVRLKPGRPTK